MTAATEKQRAALVKLGLAAPASLTKSQASAAIERAIEDGYDGRERLSLATLQARDPYGGQGTSRGRHFLCPFEACSGHQNARKHRSLSLATSGEYLCHRCGAKGLLVDSAGAGSLDSPRSSRSARDRGAASAFFARRETPTRPKEPTSTDGAAKLKSMLAGCATLMGTPGARYLEGRGVPGEIAQASGVLYHSAWYGVGAAVVFLARDERGRVTGAQGRLLDPRGKAKALNVGAFAAEGGLFATHGAGGSNVIALAEAPIDALSILAATGVPGVALFGKTLPACLRRRCALKTVLVATDADAEGEKCAENLRATLRLCVAVRRVVLPPGVKDANELLVEDPDALRAVIEALLPRTDPALAEALAEVDTEGMGLLDYARARRGAGARIAWHHDWPEARPSAFPPQGATYFERAGTVYRVEYDDTATPILTSAPEPILNLLEPEPREGLVLFERRGRADANRPGA